MLKEDTYLDNPIPSTIDNLDEINDEDEQDSRTFWCSQSKFPRF